MEEINLLMNFSLLRAGKSPNENGTVFVYMIETTMELRRYIEHSIYMVLVLLLNHEGINVNADNKSI